MAKKSQSGSFLVAQQTAGSVFNITFNNGHGDMGEGHLEVMNPLQQKVKGCLKVGKRHYSGELPLSVIGQGVHLGMSLVDRKRFVAKGNNGDRLIIQSAISVHRQDGVKISLQTCRKQKITAVQGIMDEAEAEAA